MTARRAVASVMWRGLALTSLFFYPLAAAADAQVYFLLWRPRHTLELSVAFLMVVAGFSLAVWATDRLRSHRAAALALLGMLALPALSFVTGILRSLPWKEALREVSELLLARVALEALVLGGVVALLAWPRPARATLRGALWVLSPVTIVVIVALVRLGFTPDPSHTHPSSTRPSGSPVESNVVVLLFDELSYSFLYRGREIDARYPHMAAFGARGIHYHAATAPGGETLHSLPGFIAGRRFGSLAVVGNALFEVRPDGSRRPLDLDTLDNLLRLAHRRGFRTEMVGYYLPYCLMLPTSLDTCRAFSLYNSATLADGFSVANPITTTLLLWPHQFPSGLLKNPVYAEHQRRMVVETEALVFEPMRAGRPVFRFAHFSIPHLPFVFDREGYRFDPRTDPVAADDDAYRRQMDYVDAEVGRILRLLGTDPAWSRTTVVVLSDHEFRARVSGEEVSHVPLIVRLPGARDRVDIDAPVRAEEILRRLALEAGEQAAP